MFHFVLVVSKKLNSTFNFFCNHCNVIQPPPTFPGGISHFELFNLRESFEIDLNLLETRYKNLQRLLHPDKFSLSKNEEKSHSAMQSSLVNRAFNTLKRPLSRALYLLRLKNIIVSDG
eukprot:Sdes_comp16490_c0_seq1m5808